MFKKRTRQMSSVLMRELFNELSSSIRGDLVDVVEEAVSFAEYNDKNDDNDFERGVRNLMCELIMNLSDKEGQSLERDIKYIKNYMNNGFCVSQSRTYGVFKTYLNLKNIIS